MFIQGHVHPFAGAVTFSQFTANVPIDGSDLVGADSQMRKSLSDLGLCYNTSAGRTDKVIINRLQNA
jgi:hypothetical protein